MALRQHVKHVTRFAGLDVRRYDARSEVGRRLPPLLERLGVRHVIDVGANVGQFAALLREEVDFHGRIDSFEPVGATFQELAASRNGDPSWYGHHAAVTSSAGSLTMNVYPHSVYNSVTGTTAVGARVFGAGGTAMSTEDVPGVRLDDAEMPDLGPVYLKIDTQGHDWSVMAGAPETLRRVVMLSMELSFVPMYEESVAVWESLRRLDELGFGLAYLDETVCPADDPLRIGEGDGYFVRKK